MLPSLENQTWIIDAGEAVIKKKSVSGTVSLTSAEKLIHCLWVADYGMSNAGDLVTAADVYPQFHEEAAELSKALALPFTFQTFSLTREELQRQYFERFDRVCEEIKKLPNQAPEPTAPSGRGLS